MAPASLHLISMAKTRGRKPPTTALILASGFAVVYLATLTRCYPPGVIAHACRISSFDPNSPNWAQLLRADSLLSGALNYAFYRFINFAGSWAHPLLALLILNALVGALGVWAFYSLAHRLSGQEWPSALIAIGFGVSAAYWQSVVGGSIRLPGLILAILALQSCLNLTQKRNRTAFPWVMLLAVTGATLFDIRHLLLLPIGLVAMLLAKEHSDRLWRYGGMAGGLIVLPYLGAFYMLHQQIPLFRAMSWLRPIFSGNHLLDWHSGFREFIHSIIASAPYLSVRAGSSHPLDHILASAFLLMLPAICIILLCGLIKLLRRGPDRAPMALLWLAGALYAIASIRFMSGDWMPLSLIFWGIAAMTIGKWKPPDLLGAFHRVLLVVGVGAVFVVNSWYLIVPDMQSIRNRPLQQTMKLREHTKSGDLVLILADDSELTDYVRYFTRCEVLPLASYLGNAKHKSNGDYVKAAFNELRTRVHSVLTRGGRVMLVGDMLKENSFRSLVRRHQVTQEMFLQFAEEYPPRAAYQDSTGIVWELHKKE